MNKIYVLLLVAASALAFSACQENNIEIVETPGDSIQVEILSSSYATKSADSKGDPIATYRLSDEGDKPLYLHVYKSLNRELPFCAALETKGAEITLDSLKKDASGFSIEGYLGDGKPTDASAHFLSDSVVYSSGQWLMSTEYPWLAGVPTTFWSYYPSSTASINGTRAITLPGDTDEQDEISFTYTLPTPAASSPFNDAKNQQDLLFAYNNRTWAKGQTGKIGIKFEHALAAIKFDVSEVTSSFGVSNIAFKDIHSSGTCVASASSDSTVFAWSNLGALLKYSQDFTDADFECGVQNRSKSDKMFFVIPQALESTAEIEVTFTPASGQTALTSQVKSLPIDKIVDPEDPDAYLDVVWEAGYVYTYELSYDPFTYQFGLSVAADSLKTFTNTSANSAETVIPVNSKKTFTGGTPVDHDWEIVSYKVGSSDYVDYDQDELEDVVGLTVVKDGNNIKVTSLAREPILKGSHQYWLNGGTANDWSPADWTTSTATAPIDLSKFDFATDTKNAHPMHTANCYVIRHAGTYKFPLVYGNAIIPDGTTVKANNSAYNPGLSDTDVLSRFLDYNGHGITNPFIENNTTDGNEKSASNSYLKVTGAAVQWQDKASVIKGVKLVDGTNAPATSGNPYTASSVRYVQFTVDNTLVCQNNAVISVTDASGNIVWSWHIWVTNDPGLVSSSIPVTNTKGTFNFFPVPCLGWIEPPYYPEMDDVTLELVQNDSEKKVYVTVKRSEVHDPGNGTYYQFGRKDPMPGKDGISGAFTKNITKLNDGVSLASGIQWPHHFWARIFDVGDWLTDTYYNLWTGTMKSTSANATAGIKTVYDPSPVGYRVPVPAAFAGFCDESGQCEDKTKWNVTDTDMSRLKGYTFETGDTSVPTIFFPAAGYRTFLDGTIDRLGLNSYFGTAIPKAKVEGSGYYAYGFGFSAKYMWTQDYFVRADGLSIRPVKE